MELTKVFSEIKQHNCKHCVLCFRTERVRKLKVSTSLNALVSLLDPEHVWLWKNNKKMEHYVCYMCDARVSSALRTVNMVCFAVRCVKLLNAFIKSDKIDEHLTHLSLRCQRDLSHIRKHTKLRLSDMEHTKPMKTPGMDGSEFTEYFSPNNSVASTSNTRTYTKKPITPSINPITSKTIRVMPGKNPNTLAIVPMVPQKVKIPSTMSIHTRGINLNSSPMTKSVVGINPIKPGINPITSSMITIATSTNTIRAQSNTITPLVNPTASESYTIRPSMITTSEGITITNQMIKTGTDANMATDANTEEIEPDCYIKSETESVASENQLDDDLEEALDALRDDLDDYILPDVKQVAKKRKLSKKQVKDQKNDQPAVKSTIKLVPQDKLLQPQLNPIKPDTNPIQSNTTAVNTGRILACTLNNGDMAFCPIVDFGGRNCVPALKCVLENGILSPVENIDWDKIAHLTNNAKVNNMMTDLSQKNMQGIISSISANAINLPNNINFKHVIPLTNMGSSTVKPELTNSLSLLNKDPLQIGLDTARLQGVLDTTRVQSGLDTARLQGGLDTTRVQSGLVTAILQGGKDTRSQNEFNGKAKCIFGNRNVSRQTVTIGNICQNFKVATQHRVRLCKGSNLVMFDNKIPKLLIPKLTDGEIKRYGNRTKYNNKGNELKKLRKEMRFVANPNSAYRNPNVASKDIQMPCLVYSAASNRNEISAESVARNETSKIPHNFNPNSGYRNLSVANIDSPMPCLRYSAASNQNEITPESVASKKRDNFEDNFRVFASAQNTGNVQPTNLSAANLDSPMPCLGYSAASKQNEITPESVASKKPDNFEENYRLFANVQNTGNVQPRRSDVSIDWEDKIPMDVITYMNATDPNVAEYLTPKPPQNPNPKTTSQPPPDPKDSAFGFILNCVGADDVICID